MTAGHPARPVDELANPYPPDVAHRYREAGYWTGQSFPDLLAGAVGAHGSRPAVVGTGVSDPAHAEQRWTYAELDRRARVLAGGFAGLGVGAGDRVVVWLPNVPEYLEVVWGLFLLGALPVFALPAHRESEVRYFAAHAAAVAVVTVARHDRHDHAATALRVAADVASVRDVVVVARDEDVPPGGIGLSRLRAAAAREPAGPDPSTVAFLQLSGGTTGLPKLIPRTHDDYLYSVRASAEICGLSPATVFLAVLPAAHNFTMSSPGLLGVMHAGGCSVLAPSPDADTCFGLIEREGVTLAAVVPPLAAAWVAAREAERSRVDGGRSGRALSSLAVLQVGGAKCGSELAARIGPALGCRLQQVFGMAEGLVNYTRDDDPDDVVLHTQGRPICPDDEIRVVDPEDPDERDVAPGEVGALLTRGPYTIRGYWGGWDPETAEHNATAFTPDGFYRTGDLVQLTPRGDVVVRGRVKEQINRGGEKVAAEEVENHLLAHPGVLDAALVGVPDAFLGERTHAYVVARPGVEAPAPAVLRRFVRDRGVAAFKVPDRVEVVDAFPVTGVGKTSRRALRAALAAHLTQDPAAAGPAPGEEPPR